MSGPRWIDRSVVAAALGLAILATPARAGEVSTVPRPEPAVPRARLGSVPPAPERGPTLFPREQIVSRATAHLQFLMAVDQSPGGLPSLDPEILGELSHSVRQSAEQAGRSALRSHLRNVLDLSAPTGLGRSRPLGAEGRLGIQADLHHGLPELEMHYRLGRGALKWGVTVDGSVGFSYRDDRAAKARVWAGFDGQDAWQIQARFGF